MLVSSLKTQFIVNPLASLTDVTRQLGASYKESAHSEGIACHSDPRHSALGSRARPLLARRCIPACAHSRRVCAFKRAASAIVFMASAIFSSAATRRRSKLTSHGSKLLPQLICEVFPKMKYLHFIFIFMPLYHWSGT